MILLCRVVEQRADEREILYQHMLYTVRSAQLVTCYDMMAQCRLGQRAMQRAAPRRGAAMRRRRARARGAPCRAPWPLRSRVIARQIITIDGGPDRGGGGGEAARARTLAAAVGLGSRPPPVWGWYTGHVRAYAFCARSAVPFGGGGSRVCCSRVRGRVERRRGVRSQPRSVGRPWRRRGLPPAARSVARGRGVA